MSVLPVLDIRHGIVVHAVAGQRARYRPLQTPWSESSSPGDVANGLRRRFGWDEVYLADLDAIMDAKPDPASWEQIGAVGWRRMWIDAGMADLAAAERLLPQTARVPAEVHWIVGLESIREPGELAPLAARLGSSTVFSLDLRHGRPLTVASRWRGATPRDLAAEAVEAGFTRILVLDLGAVGSGLGPVTIELCGNLCREFPRVELWSGGGVRQPADAQLLLDAGCRKVLVGTALHGRHWPRNR